MFNKIATTRKLTLFLPVLLFFLLSCKKTEDNPKPAPFYPKFTIKPSITYQEMVGFGGALTWYANNVTNSPKKDEIYNLMFSDLGMDILRLKNWYYPTDYPNNKSPQNMAQTDVTMLNVTKTLALKAKEMNPSMKIEFSSWGPSAYLKSNNDIAKGGTLKKDNSGKYMYKEYAQYCVDMLDNIGFNPDYLSIQNEVSFTADWASCVWGTSETATVASYKTALDSVYNRIRNRSFVPVLIGPEAENMPVMMNFAPVVKNVDYCPIYSWHPYNWNKDSELTSIATSLKSFAANFGNKPNFMTEYSGMPWFKTARFIQQTLQYANTSAYIYWELVWGTPEQAMIHVDNAGNYTVNPFYYVIKHFSKYIDNGYKRIEVSTTNGSVEVTGYINPAKDRITLIAINTSASVLQFKFDLQGYSIKDMKAYQTVEGDYFKDLGQLSPDDPLRLYGNSITTIVLSL